MAKPAPSLKIVVTDRAGKTSRARAGRIEIDLGEGRRLRIEPSAAAGALVVEAVAKAGAPVITLQPAAPNLVTLRVDVAADREPAADEGAAAVAPHLELAVQRALVAAERPLAPKKAQLARWARAALRRDAEVTVRLVGEDEGRALNRDYRGKDYATNVLTFVYGDDVGRGDGSGAPAPLMGDLVLCVPVVVREAAEQGKALEAHYAHLVVHGMLHLQGYDHEEEREAARMEALETELLTRMGYADPYA